MKQKSRELGETAKDAAHNKLHQGQDKVDEYRVSAVQLFRDTTSVRLTDRPCAGVRKGETRNDAPGD